MKVWDGYRNQHSTLDTKRGAAIEKLCAAGCGAFIPKAKTYCPACYDERLEKNIAKNRSKYAGRKYGRAKEV